MTNKPKYPGLGIALGAGLGAAFGVLAGHIGLWLGIGVAIGIVIGASFRGKQTNCPECAQIRRIHEMRNPSTKLAARS
jgi:lipoprotein signal peptidase